MRRSDAAIEMNDEQLMYRIRAEYLEMPGLRLTPPQARRLLGLDEQTCSRVLKQLVSVRFLRQGAGGVYVRVADDVRDLA